MISIAIDASNLRAGGGVTHLVEVLRHLDPEPLGVGRVTVWSARRTLDQLPERPWLVRAHDPLLERALPYRTWWQRRTLPRIARGCDVVFAPAAAGPLRIRPYVTMCRNMLPFDPPEMRRYAYGPIFFRLAALRVAQSAAFRRADGVIFLNDYARRTVAGVVGERPEFTVIPHGISDDFRAAPREQKPIGSYDASRPFRFLYTSIVDLYKHQWQVAEAILSLAEEGLPVALDLVGPSYPPAMRKLEAVLARHANHANAVQWHGAVPHRELPSFYARADAFVFASTCENMPNVLIEAMAAGLPIACSRKPPMPDVLEEGGVYFDAESAGSIAAQLRALLLDPALRAAKAARAFELAARVSWERCARDTFAFLARVATRRTR
jgi:glycosyltransferase involved in cell wall biosynthesis